MTKFIFTADGGAGVMAVNELNKSLGQRCKFLGYIWAGVGLMEAEFSFAQISEAVRANTTFVRHIFPVAHSVHLKYDNVEDLYRLFDEIGEYGVEHLNKWGTFSVQTRLYIEDAPFKKNDVNEAVAGKIEAMGFEKRYKQPAQVLSVVFSREMVYYGVSDAFLNLSHWPGGECRYKKGDNVISRAEFKLLEAVDVFGLDLSHAKTALDLGAAPGGWTRVLAEQGLLVTCVDPGALDPRVAGLDGVTHYKCLAQDYFIQQKDSFDLIVNDMKMDAYESIDLMKTALTRLKPSGICVMTLKLKSGRTQAQLNKAFLRLEAFCHVTHKRQLYHNRTEVTVVLGGLKNDDKT